MFQKIISYIKESITELKKVVWPSRKETIKYTILVIGISIVTAIFLGAIDFGLNLAIEQII